MPRGLHFSISKSPSPPFKNTYSMNALPSLNGSVGYIFTSCHLDVKGSGDVRFKDMVDHFKVHDLPRRPEGKDEEYLAGERVDTRGECVPRLARPWHHTDPYGPDYLLYGRVYIPTGRLDALYSTRLSPTLQAMVAAISDPRASLFAESGRTAHVPPSNIMFSLQHDTGRWCTEYTWSAEDGMWGVRTLHNFGRAGTPSEAVDEGEGGARSRRVDEEEAMEGGLKGRISAGAEFYFSAKEKSAGGERSCCAELLLSLTVFSVDWDPVCDTTRCDAPVLPNDTDPSSRRTSRTALTAANNHNRAVQPHAGTHLCGVHRPRLPRAFVELPVRLQRV